MPQVILKKRTADLATYTFFTRDVDQYKNTSFYSSINHQELLFTERLSLAAFAE